MRSWRALALAALLAAGSPALASLVELPVPGAGTCTLSVDVLRCTGTLPQPTRTPGPQSTPVYAGCPPDAANLDRPLETQATLRGFYGLTFTGTRTFKFCAKPAVPSSRGGNLGAAWIDSGSQCSQLRIRLVSMNGQPVANGSTGWSGTPQLTYKLLFPGFSAPAGTYYFELDADASACPNRAGRFQVIWTP